VLYARAVTENFDITIDQPQPPGHIFYVGLIWLVNRVFADPNAAMVWISIFFASASVAALYWLGKVMFNRGAGLTAALLLSTSLSFWALSETAYPYTLLAFLSIALAGLFYHIREGNSAWVVPAGLLLGIASGFRQDLLPFMLPLLAFTIWKQGGRRIAGCLLLLGVGIAAWYIPSALLSGGFAAYQEASSQQSDYLMSYFSVFGLGAGALASNGYALLRFCLYALTAASALVPIFIALIVSPRTRGLVRDRRLVFITVWIAPSILFYFFIHVGEYGYVFFFLPALLLLGAWSLQLLVGGWLSRTQGAHRAGLLIAPVLVMANLLLFLVLSPPLAANRLAARDNILQSKLDTIRDNFDPASTFIIAVFDHQQALYYLPEYRHWTFDPSVDANPSTDIPPGTGRVVIFEEYLQAGDSGAMTLPLDRDQTLIYLPAGGKEKVRVDWDSRKVYLEDE